MGLTLVHHDDPVRRSGAPTHSPLGSRLSPLHSRVALTTPVSGVLMDAYGWTLERYESRLARMILQPIIW